jgi:3-phenylpropionate/trans-cinnamate dioxygenase ferredoxin subunit
MRLKWLRLTSVNALESVKQNENSLIRVLLHGQAYCILYSHNQYYVLKDQCPHAGARLSDGWCQAGKVICPLHRMAFDPSTGREATGSGYGVEVFACEVRGNDLYIGIPLKWWAF